VSQRARFVCYQPKTILNKGKRADHWFWSRYSAYPYMGCQHGCAFCYCRERKYIPHKPAEVDAVYDAQADEFSHLIKVKENAPQLLRKALAHLPIDILFTGDYQPAERIFKISRQILELCLELGFPVAILERSPLVLRDLDLLKEINQRAPSVVFFSLVSAPGSPSYEKVQQLENLAPSMLKRYKAMEQISNAGILTGASMMPILPGLCDSDENLEATVRWTAEHGGRFVLAGGLTLADQQRDYFYGILRKQLPELLPLYQRLYPAGSYGAVRSGDPHAIGKRVRELCTRYGISDRMPRPIIPGDKRFLNKRIVELLANKVYTLELQNASPQQIWRYRKAAWAIEDLEQDIGLVHQSMGIKGLESIPEVSPSLAVEIESLMQPAKKLF